MLKQIKKMMACAVASAVIAVTGMSAFSNSIAHAETESKLIALTFDDGPNTTTTNGVLDILED